MNKEETQLVKSFLNKLKMCGTSKEDAFLIILNTASSFAILGDITLLEYLKFCEVSYKQMLQANEINVNDKNS